MPRDREFQRKKKDTRMPVRDSHAEEIAGTRQKEADFDLRRARDGPSSAGTGRHRTYSAAAQPTAEDLQKSAFDMPQQEDVSTPGEPEGWDLDSEPARESDAGGTSVQEATIPETHRRDFGYEDHRHEDSFIGDSGTGRPAREESSRTAHSGQTDRRRRMHQYGNKYQQRFQEAAKAEGPQEKQPGTAEGEPKRPSKLEFTADELPPETADKKLTQARPGYALCTGAIKPHRTGG